MVAKQNKGVYAPDGSLYITLTDGDGNLATTGSSGLTVGTTTITSGTDTRILYNNSGVLGEYTAATAKTFLSLAQADITGLTTTSTPTFQGLALTGQSLTGSTATSLIDMATTWNTTGNPTALKLIVTNTASGSGANLIDIKLGATSYFLIDKYGQGRLATSLSFGTAGTAGTYGAQATLARNQGATGFGFHATTGTSAPDISLNSLAAGVYRITNGSTGGGALELIEQTAPAAGDANTVRLFAQDNGAGKTQLMVQFASGTAQQIAIEA